MPRKSSKPAASPVDAEETEEVAIDIAADVEAIDAEPMDDVIVEVVPDAQSESCYVPAKFSRFPHEALVDALAAYDDALVRGLPEEHAVTTGVIAGKEWLKRNS